LNGLPHGIWEFYTKRGKLEFKDSYENGELIFSQTYYVGGQLKAKENYKNKQKHGISETFSKTGELEGRTNFKNGNVDGLVELFNVDGQEYQSFCYRNNEAAQMSYCEI
jgi:antitoxin component YwqK of YwqJK toxin-antitoxin module